MPKGETLILDIGCGGTDNEFGLSGFPSDVGIDIRRPFVRRENFVLASAEALPFRDKCFNFAQSFEVLEHVNNPYLMLSEMKRTARKILVTTPNSLQLPNVLMSIARKNHAYICHSDHILIWSKAELENLLNRVGLVRCKVSFSPYRERKHRWFIELALRLVPFPALKYRDLLVVGDA